MKSRFSNYTKKYKKEFLTLLDYRKDNTEISLLVGVLLLGLLILKLIL
jgi:hypothetical protein